MLKFLIIDDDEDDRDLFCDAVNQIDPDILCLTAKNGQEGLEHLKSGKLPQPDIIFLDLNMPRLNGVQTLTELKKDERLKNIPVIIYTTSKLDEVREETSWLGSSGFMTKPTSQKVLKAAIVQIMQEQLNFVSSNSKYNETATGD